MEQNLSFTTNWNGKLNCSCFTTLRLHNHEKYFAGAVMNIILNGQLKGKAVIIQVNYFTIEKINEFVARIDTGYSATECQKMIKEMYKNNPRINWKTQLLDFCLLEYQKEAKSPSLFS